MPRFGNAVLGVFAFLACGRLAAAPAHDLFLCADTSSDYIVGAQLVTPNGIFRRGADGSFRHIGINFPQIFNISADPRNPRVFYTACINGCLKTTDGGWSWRICTGWDVAEAKDVCVDPNSPDHVYVALPDGIAVSADRGATWARREQGLPDRGKYTETIEADRTRAGRILAGCASGIYLTEDGAQSWRLVQPTKATVDDVQQSPRDPNLWFSVTQSDGALASRDGGITWERFPGVPGDQALYNVAFDPTRPGRCAISSWTYGVLTTEDGGRTWVYRNAGLPAGHFVYRVGVDPDSGRLYASVYHDALYVSDDFGRTWKSGGFRSMRIFNFDFLPVAVR